MLKKQVKPKTFRPEIGSMERAGTKVGIPEEVIGLVIGKKHSNFNRIEKETGAKIAIFRKEVYVTGGPQECKNAIQQLKTSAFIGVNHNWLSQFTRDTYNFVGGSGDFKLDLAECPRQDWWNQKEYFKIKNIVDEEDHQHHGQMIWNGEMGDLNNFICEVLQKIQGGCLPGEMPKADFWCHFGHLYITTVDEDDQDKIYPLKDFQSQFNNENGWKMMFDSAIKDMKVKELEEALSGTKYKKIPPHIRYDLCFITPSCTRIRVKFFLDSNGEPNLNFMDQFIDIREDTLSSTSKYIFCHRFVQRAKVNIAIPAHAMDVRITIRTVSSTLDMAEREHEEALKEYLDRITFTDEGKIILPDDKDMPYDFVLRYIRKCNRRSYSYNDRDEDTFTIVVSEEEEIMDGAGEVKTDIHLYSDQCYQLLRSGDWQPEQITRKLPTFLLALRDIQDNINSIET